MKFTVSISIVEGSMVNLTDKGEHPAITFAVKFTSVVIPVTGTWVFIGISLAAQIAIWGLIVGLFYRDYLSMREIRFIIQEVRTALSKTKTEDIDSAE